MRTASILGLSGALCCVAILTAQDWEQHTPPPQAAVVGLEVRHLKIEQGGLSTPMVFRLWQTGQVDWSVLMNGEWTAWEAIGE